MLKNQLKPTGFTMIELVLVIIIIGIISGIATRSLVRVFRNANYTSTVSELNVLAEAMVGNPAIIQNNLRTNYGYVGDIGQFPPTLEDLISNVSGLDGWDGPYIDLGFSDDPDYYKQDAWNNPYVYTVPGDLNNPPIIMTPADGDTLTREIAKSVNSILNNTITIQLLNSDGVKIDGNNGIVQIYYTGSWHDFSYSNDNGFQIFTVPIGIYQIQAIAGSDTTYKSVGVGPDNSTTGQPAEMLVYASWGDLQIIAGSVGIEGTCQDQLYFDLKNTGSVTYEISQVGLAWGSQDSSCWNCEHPYLKSLHASGNQYWLWNDGHSALVDSGAIIALDSKLYLYSGENTLGPFTFEDASDGTGNCINVSGSAFTFKFFSNLAPTRTISFNGPGSCGTPSLSINGTVTWGSGFINIPVKNTGALTATFTANEITTDIASLAYLSKVQYGGSDFWAAPGIAECSGVTRPRVDGDLTGIANFQACTGWDLATLVGNETTTIRIELMDDASGSTGVTLSSGIIIDLQFNFVCPSGHTQLISFALP
ncbi:MAG: type II secretion system protein GspG [Candidatus Marinimicrobia bacterium]|nr:type II secretion system protein GspG [Candidatus Neomarinimicrobiota bacterium]